MDREAALLPRPIKLIPFLPSTEAGASAPIEVAINFVLFIPFGLYLGVIAPTWRWWQAAGVFLGASLMLEITQYLISVGSFDTTDLIVNTAGGLAGLGLLALVRRRLRARTSVVMTRGFAIGTVVSLLAIGIFIASPLHYGPQRDVIVSAPAGDHSVGVNRRLRDGRRRSVPTECDNGELTGRDLPLRHRKATERDH